MKIIHTVRNNEIVTPDQLPPPPWRFTVHEGRRILVRHVADESPRILPVPLDSEIPERQDAA